MYIVQVVVATIHSEEIMGARYVDRSRLPRIFRVTAGTAAAVKILFLGQDSLM